MTLRGLRILVTRDDGQAAEFAALIRRRGGVPVLFPTVSIVPPEDMGPLVDAAGRLDRFDWVLFGSANAARFFLDVVESSRGSLLPEGIRVASVGPGTSREITRRGFPVHLTAATHSAEGLVDALAGEGIAAKRFLVPRALAGRETLAAELSRRGGLAETVVAYRNVLPERGGNAAAAILSDPPDVCTFASPSAFRNFFTLLGEEGAASVLSRSRIAAIGEVTARAVEERNFRVDIVPKRYTLTGMLEAISERLASGAPAEEGSNDLS